MSDLDQRKKRNTDKKQTRKKWHVSCEVTPRKASDLV